MPQTVVPTFYAAQLSTTPNRKRWTRQECEKMEEAGILPQRYELIQGEIYDKVTVNPPHSITLTLLAAWLEQLFGRLQVRTQDPIRLPDGENKPDPDIVVMREEITAYLQQHPGPMDLLLVAEISDTTLAFDLNDKARVYAQAGVIEYWVVDLGGRRLLAHRGPAAEGFQEIVEYTEHESAAPLCRPDAIVCVNDILAPRTSATYQSEQVTAASKQIK